MSIYTTTDHPKENGIGAVLMLAGAFAGYEALWCACLAPALETIHTALPVAVLLLAAAGLMVIAAGAYRRRWGTPADAGWIAAAFVFGAALGLSSADLLLRLSACVLMALTCVVYRCRARNRLLFWIDRLATYAGGVALALILFQAMYGVKHPVVRFTPELDLRLGICLGILLALNVKEKDQARLFAGSWWARQLASAGHEAKRWMFLFACYLAGCGLMMAALPAFARLPSAYVMPAGAAIIAGLAIVALGALGRCWLDETSGRGLTLALVALPTAFLGAGYMTAFDGKAGTFSAEGLIIATAISGVAALLVLQRRSRFRPLAAAASAAMGGGLGVVLSLVVIAVLQSRVSGAAFTPHERAVVLGAGAVSAFVALLVRHAAMRRFLRGVLATLGRIEILVLHSWELVATILFMAMLGVGIFLVDDFLFLGNAVSWCLWAVIASIGILLLVHGIKLLAGMKSAVFDGWRASPRPEREPID